MMFSSGSTYHMARVLAEVVLLSSSSPPPPEGAVGGGRRTAVAAALRHGDTAVALHPMGGTTAGIPRVEGNLGAEEVEGGVVEEVPETEAGPRRRSACVGGESGRESRGEPRPPPSCERNHTTKSQEVSQSHSFCGFRNSDASD